MKDKILATPSVHLSADHAHTICLPEDRRWVEFPEPHFLMVIYFLNSSSGGRSGFLPYLATNISSNFV